MQANPEFNRALQSVYAVLWGTALTVCPSTHCQTLQSWSAGQLLTEDFNGPSWNLPTAPGTVTQDFTTTAGAAAQGWYVGKTGANYAAIPQVAALHGGVVLTPISFLPVKPARHQGFGRFVHRMVSSREAMLRE